MIYATTCSGIEAPSLAWHALGWKPAFFSEIDAFPCKVLAHHHPHVPNHGDMTKFKEWPDAAIDVLCGGTPCQSFSVAGLRQGLRDPRGNLMLTHLAIAHKYRPRWLVWENVPGVLSSNDGRDFGAFVSALGQLGYGWAYRVLDAQYFGVPQRRRRVFVIGYLGDWRRAAAVLFDAHSLSGNPPPQREARGAVGALTANGVGTCGADDNQAQAGHLIAHTLRGTGFDASEDGTGRGVPLVPVPHAAISPALKARDAKGPSTSGDGDGDGAILVPMMPIAFDPTQITSAGNRSNPQPGDACHTLSKNQHAPAIAYRTAGDGAVYEEGPVTAPLTTGTDPSATVIAFSGRSRGPEGNRPAREPHCMMEKIGALDSTKPWNIATGMRVRRLTPRECERLQGFPDDYTRIPLRIYAKRKITAQRPAHRWQETAEGWALMAADGPRYKALGNSMAVPVMRWIGERMQMVDEIV